MKSLDEVDVVIVGSGAAGSLLAAKLSQAGRSVLILEGGPQRVADDLYSSQIWARRIHWTGPPTDTGGQDPISVGFGSGWGTGGASLHHYGVWLRRHPDDFHMQTEFGKGLDWPMSYDDLRPFYDEIQQEIGLSGDAKAEVWRPAGDPYPMPPLEVFTQGKLIARGFDRAGLRISPLPMAINSVPYGGRPACLNDGWCDAGCPILALANPLAVYLPQAIKAGAVLQHESYVTRVLTDGSRSKALGVEYYLASGEKQVQRARIVIVAAYSFQTPRILLNSATSRYPNGLANGSGRVGSYMMSHATSNVFGLFSEETKSYQGRTGGQLLCQDAYAKDPEARGYVNSSQWLIANALKPNDLLGIVNSRPEIFGAALATFMQRAAKHAATMTFVGEDLPRPENRLSLQHGKDQYGFPLAHVIHNFGSDDLACYNAGMKQGHSVFEAAGAQEVWHTGRVRMHAMGGAIMGSDPGTSVTNSYGQTHEVDNLFVAGPSLFPTSGAVNPNFTIHAVTLRTAKYILKHWRDFA